MLVVVDSFSKYLWLRPLKDKTGPSIRDSQFAQNESKASISERVLKTAKAKIYRYFTYKNAHRCIDQLQSFADGYKSTVHKTIDMAPKM